MSENKNITLESVAKEMIDSARERTLEKAKENDALGIPGLHRDQSLTPGQIEKNNIEAQALHDRGQAQRTEDFMENIIAPGLLFSGAILAYGLYVWADRKGWKHSIALAIGLFVVALLASQAASWGFDAIVADVWLLSTIGLMYLVGGWLNRKHGFKPSIAAVVVIFLASAVGSGMVGIDQSSRCYTDWDGRSNPTVCD